MVTSTLIISFSRIVDHSLIDSLSRASIEKAKSLFARGLANGASQGAAFSADHIKSDLRYLLLTNSELLSAGGSGDIFLEGFRVQDRGP